ncbi:hypothetical protein F6P96_08555 [Escherichia coli]|nr:hypothetical protein F6P96_08555 [Escherichia coli]
MEAQVKRQEEWRRHRPPDEQRLAKAENLLKAIFSMDVTARGIHRFRNALPVSSTFQLTEVPWRPPGPVFDLDARDHPAIHPTVNQPLSADYRYLRRKKPGKRDTRRASHTA